MSDARNAPFTVLVVGVMSQISSGLLQWLPAIMPNIQQVLSLTSSQSALIVLLATSGSSAGVLGGFFHRRYGNQISASIGNVGTGLVMLSLALLTKYPALISSSLQFPFLIFLTLIFVISSFLLYASSVSAPSSVFPQNYRGRIVGIIASAYGGSGAILAAVQAAFFSDVSATSTYLALVSLYCFAVGIASFVTFPKVDRYDPDSLHIADTYHALNPGDVDQYVANSFRIAYVLMFACFFVLQTAALADVLQAHILVKVGLAIGVLALLVVLSIYLCCSQVRIMANGPPESAASAEEQQQENKGVTEGASEISAQQQEEPSLSVVLTDVRYIFYLATCIIFNGGGGVALLVQLPFVLTSMQNGASPQWIGASVSDIMRALTMAFSALNMGARLIMGTVSDKGSTTLEQHMWKYSLLLVGITFMSSGLGMVAFGLRWVLVGAVMLSGFSYGTFYAIMPALMTAWFGIRGFGRNLVFGTMADSAGSALLASLLPELLRRAFGEWKAIGEEGAGEAVCGGRWCFTPMFVTLAVLCKILFLCGAMIRPTVRRRAEKGLY